MRINHNIAALNTLNRLSSNNSASQKNMEKLSSGLRINRVGDDAAGLAISEKMRGQIRGLEMASKNSQDGISLIQTAEGALTETHAILQRVRELVVQAGNTGTQDKATDLQSIQDEISALTDEIDGISNRTEFHGKKLLDGTYKVDTATPANQKNLVFQIGANATQQISVNIEDMGADALGIKEADGSIAALHSVNDLDVTKFADNAADCADIGFDAQLKVVDEAINQVSSQRAKLGAVQNRLEHTINNLSASGENLTAAESRIRDVDMAKEMSEFTKNNILSQASQAMLAQANQQPQNVLQLLR
uniref:Flagellin n=1 Tax=Bacillus subtilis TaxID=1423 RepID=UPI000C01F49A|nr:Chain A, Flagellin [Bacillus subtilis]5WJU_B Chain B, Flagellin [Bacillus subtilis]5WJU_C Chain C, Flagellin [Bacillus subtilis]5WJU_D Chain D, Flagellin [Bacillus subtilis]5WJU_E Chain E, Flagellin [Bacillus subtilis]5WJU_F Chain F, Flagellin [Bacillus subtilis]5WJU_G Chain G, Flagellin [Bacillus subtilis]5WJU_H Chain H, Flagellin [Bacillus subtilis]5WJU_I Chain I, Flagellin [Bacillus subtilis]5WJU_J Chain J, Flagellin [Bacillus subtilis]5WJU_K Chain K, Flagellin [Bacillus subtilis]5